MFSCLSSMINGEIIIVCSSSASFNNHIVIKVLCNPIEINENELNKLKNTIKLLDDDNTLEDL